MRKFIIETTIEAPAREFWQVEAASRDEAREAFERGEVDAFLWDEVQGDETDREIAEVHDFADLAGTIALHNAQQQAPAMLAALRSLMPLALEALANRMESDDEEDRSLLPSWQADYDAAQAILADIDGTAPPIPAAPAPTGEAAPDIAAIVAMGLWRAKAGQEIAARKSPKKSAPVLAGIKSAASHVASEIAGKVPGFDRGAFMAQCGYQREC